MMEMPSKEEVVCRQGGLGRGVRRTFGEALLDEAGRKCEHLSAQQSLRYSALHGPGKESSMGLHCQRVAQASGATTEHYFEGVVQHTGVLGDQIGDMNPFGGEGGDHIMRSRWLGGICKEGA
jgi:hypothetical protein